jgi:ABC-type Mn2+/Zn2+ transport system permease subunit
MSTMLIETATVALSLCMAAAAGLIGCFAVMRKMTLAADAFSHVALPGIGIALVLHAAPLSGALVMLLIGAVLIWALESQTRISTETVVGVVFSAALAVGSMFTTGEELVDALFGGPARLTEPELVLGLAGAIGVVVFIMAMRHRLVVALISPEIAMTAGVNVKRLNLLFLVTFAVTVGLGLRYLGVLLMGSLIIIPAATARRLATNLNGMLAISVSVSMVSTLAGTQIAALMHHETGPLIVCVAAACFFLSLLRRQAT